MTGLDRLIDLRSDTVTVPTPAMLDAMMHAEVGDDGYSEDPSINRLEAMVAETLGKEAAMFVPSGTMANLVCIKTHTEPGDEAILHVDSHCFYYEVGGYAAVAGISFRLVQGERGIVQPEQVEQAIRAEAVYFPRSRLVIIENTHNLGGGSVYPVETVRRLGELCRARGLKLHMDGARLFNACIAAGVSPTEYTRHVDSVMVCLSKGLGCPIGSVVAGDAQFIARARRFRKMLGGSMRQAGYLAAAGIYALQHNVERLTEDHENARLLADGIRGVPGLELKYDPPETNMVYFEVLPPMTPEAFVEALRDEGVLIAGQGRTFRAVTHIGIAREDVEKAIEAIRRVMR